VAVIATMTAGGSFSRSAEIPFISMSRSTDAVDLAVPFVSS
jgi:hypothetical protein